MAKILASKKINLLIASRNEAKLKSYVLNFSEALAKELEDYNVTVSCLSPGPTDKNFFSDLDKSNVENPYLHKKSRLSVEKVAKMGRMNNSIRYYLVLIIISFFIVGLRSIK